MRGGGLGREAGSVCSCESRAVLLPRKLHSITGSVGCGGSPLLSCLGSNKVFVSACTQGYCAYPRCSPTRLQSTGCSLNMQETRPATAGAVWFASKCMKNSLNIHVLLQSSTSGGQGSGNHSWFKKKKKNNNNNKNQLISHLSAQMRTLLGLILNPSYGKPSKVGSPLLWLLSIVLLVPSPC